MKVRTIRQHSNRYPPQFVKNFGRKYELPDSEARTLIGTGVVEQADADEEDDGA